METPPIWQEGEGEAAEEAGVLSADEWLTERQELISQLAVLWNAFLNLHRLFQRRISQLLRDRWEASRLTEAAQWMVGTEMRMNEDDIFGVSGSDWAEQWRSPKSTLATKPQEERAQLSASRAELYKTNLTNAKSKHIPFQDLRYFADPAAQPIIFAERHEAGNAEAPALLQQPGLPRSGDHGGSQLDRLADSGEPGLADGRAGGKPASRRSDGRHVVVFVHGFQGHHLDLRLIRNHWMIMDPEIECLMSDINEDRTFDGFAEMGHRLADEVAGLLGNMFGSRTHPSRRHVLGKLSFVGHSIGNVIIRAAIADKSMEPYRQYLYTYLSVSGPHLGYLYSSNSLFNGGLWLLKRVKGAHVMHQLTFTDHPDIRQCYLYGLCQMAFFEYFQNVVLLSSPQDRYVPYHSARIEMCPAAMRDPKRGAAYASMVQGCLTPLLKAGASSKKSFVRCDVNFDISAQARSLNSIIGRTAHIEFLETDVYIRFFLWYYRDLFV